MKMIILFVLILSIVLLLVGCVKKYQKKTWTMYTSMKELAPKLKNEKIEKVFLCDGDPETDVDLWFVFGELSKEQVDITKDYLIDEPNEHVLNLQQQEYSVYTCQDGMLKIETDKGKYGVPAGLAKPPGWRQYTTLIGLWPILQKQKIQKIGFCKEEELNVNIDRWHTWYLPEEKLNEFIKLTDKAMKEANRQFDSDTFYHTGRMKIITNKAKYLVAIQNDSCTNNPKLSGNGWSSNELGEYLKKSGFCENTD